MVVRLFWIFFCLFFFESFYPITEYNCLPYFHNIWRVSIVVKVQVFSFTVALGKLQTCDSLQRRWTSCALSPNWCGLCRNKEEDQDHLLLHCPFTYGLWSRVLQELGFE